MLVLIKVILAPWLCLYTTHSYQFDSRGFQGLRSDRAGMVRTMSIDTEKNLNEIHANQMTDMREVICSAVKEFESEVLSRGPFSQASPEVAQHTENLSRTVSRCTNTVSASYDYYTCAICHVGKSEDNFLSRYCLCKDTFTHQICIQKELTNTKRSRCRHCATRYNCKRTIKPVKHWNLDKTFLLVASVFGTCLLAFTGLFIAALKFLARRLHNDEDMFEVIVIIVYVVVSYAAIAIGQSSKVIMFIEYSLCCVSKLDAVLPI